MKQLMSDLRQFHHAFDVPVKGKLEFPNFDRVALRMALMDEEFNEMIDAINAESETA